MRNLMTASFLLLAGAALAEFTGGLYFENLTRGTSNDGILLANPGDQIGVHFAFHGSGSSPNKWGTVEIALCGEGPVLTASDASSWVSQVTSHLTPANAFLVKDVRGDVTYYYAVEPFPLVLCHGVYLLVAVNASSPLSRDWDVTLFQFTAHGQAGDTLAWLDNAYISTDMEDPRANTYFIDLANHFYPPSNTLLIVPEPVAAAPLLLLIGLRRRR